MKPKSADLERVLKEYFKYASRTSRLGRTYSFHVRTGWGYEGVNLYAYDTEHDWYLKEHISPAEIDDHDRGRKTFGEAIGVHINALEERLYEHEKTFLRGYH